MKSPYARKRKAGNRGTALIEFSVSSCVLLFVVLLAGVEFGRMALVYTTVANAARAGARYAVVHGSLRSAITGVNGSSGPGNNPPEVVTMVKNFASTGVLSTSRLTVTVTYPAGTNTVGSPVTVTVVYPYDPLTSYLPLQFNIGSTTQGTIAF